MERLEEVVRITIKYVRVYGSRVPAYIDQDDLLSEAFVRVFKYLRSYDPNRGDLEGFLKQHVWGAIKDYLRKSNSLTGGREGTRFLPLLSLTVSDDGSETGRRTLDIPDENSNPEMEYISREELPRLIKGIGQRLHSKYWLVLLLYYWEDKTLLEIGELLGINESRVSQIHNEALNKLSGALYSNGIVRMSQLLK